MSDREQVQLRLPADVIALLQEVAETSNESLDTVTSVLLAMYIVSKKREAAGG